MSPVAPPSRWEAWDKSWNVYPELLAIAPLIIRSKALQEKLGVGFYEIPQLLHTNRMYRGKSVQPDVPAASHLPSPAKSLNQVTAV